LTKCVPVFAIVGSLYAGRLVRVLGTPGGFVAVDDADRVQSAPCPACEDPGVDLHVDMRCGSPAREV
jgi:hypothetical protein